MTENPPQTDLSSPLGDFIHPATARERPPLSDTPLEEIKVAGESGEAVGLPSRRASLGYPTDTDNRDLRFDFMRGLAMLSLITAHFEAFSWPNFLFWERLGIVTGAEMFVIAAGLLLGLVNRKTLEKRGIEEVTVRQLRRSFELYRAAVGLIFVVVFWDWLGLGDTTAVTTFTDRFAQQTYRLVPLRSDPWWVVVGRILLLRSSPHQIQILGLYVVLLATAPLMLWLLKVRLLGLYFGLSWALYFLHWLQPVDYNFLGMQFEYAFPPLAWQLIFTHALAVGYFRTEIAAWLTDPGRRTMVVAASILLWLAFFIFAQATPNPSFPAWSRLPILPSETFQQIYDTYFPKNRLGLLRIVNDAAFFAAFYVMLTYFWRPINAALGWLLLPLGQASLYVFLLHVLFIGLADQLPSYFDAIPIYDPIGVWINTAVWLGIILGLWLLVRNKVLFSIIPR